MRTRLALGITVAGVCALAPPPTGASGADPPSGVRLEGAFLMRGTVTLAHNVFGERRGQRLQRTWTFVPQCATGVCNRVTLRRGRSGRHILDVVTLRRRGPRLYSGTGRFWVALRCGGDVIRHGGRATEKITVRIIHTTTVGTTRLPTRVSATYKNPQDTARQQAQNTAAGRNPLGQLAGVSADRAWKYSIGDPNEYCLSSRPVPRSST